MTVNLDRDKLREKRKDKGLTQEKLAEEAGISDRHMRSIETEEVIPSSAVLYRISQTLGTTMDELMVESESEE